ncbi:MAG: class IIb bacteriocin, lactobin A/cerein 7B family [Cruoricaptor ignavus]|nr:class IIb bacteriocin, lactobin A/cerein 7B family [Cruoricaptor ignavus]
MDLKNLKVQELNEKEMKKTDGGVVPVAVAVWWAGASLLTKVSVVAGGTAIAGTAGAVGYYNGFFDTVK